ncbi:MAG: class II fructose-1,6-bisphosphate aldolase [Proteobacteria bacterium]|nr:class II fructose-1,6-bisphosphate aldolase [Pseudomonadota bacterium]
MAKKVSYKEIGLSNTKEMFKKAYAGGYAIPGYNFNNLEQLQAIIRGSIECKAPVILQLSSGARKYADPIMLKHMGMGAVEYARDKGSNIPIVMHLDHGDSFELAKSCIDNGFSSVMIDGSHLSFEENIKVSKQVVQYAHDNDVSVEAELGVLAGIEDDVHAEHSNYTDPDEVEEFVGKTGVDSLAISIGTSHGAYKFKPKAGETPQLRFDILDEVVKRLPGFPIVLHGASSVVPEYVAIINKFGGNMKDAMGVPEDQLRRAARSAVCKINIDSDGRLAFTAMVRKSLAEDPSNFDPRKYLGAAREELVKLTIAKDTNVLGCAGKA